MNPVIQYSDNAMIQYVVMQCYKAFINGWNEWMPLDWFQTIICNVSMYILGLNSINYNYAIYDTIVSSLKISLTPILMNLLRNELFYYQLHITLKWWT